MAKTKRKTTGELVVELRQYHHYESANRIEGMRVALRSLMKISERVAMQQPAKISKTQEEADHWSEFYGAIHAASAALGPED